MESFDRKLAAMQTQIANLRADDQRQNEGQVLSAQTVAELQGVVEELHVAEEELRQQNDELAAQRTALESERYRYIDLFEFAPDGYLVTDLFGVIREANRAAGDLLDMEQRFLVGKPLMLFTHERTPGWLQQEIHRITSVNRPTERSMELKRRDGGLFDASVTAAPIHDVGGKPTGVRWLLRDDTQRHKNELEIRTLNADLERRVAQRTAQLESANRIKDYFLAMLSHELRTPLTPVLALAESLKERRDLPEEIRDDLAMIHRNVALEARLIDDLLDLTRSTWGKLRLDKRPVDAHDVLRQAADIVETDWNEKKLKFTQDLSAPSHHVHADAARLQQVFWNIIKNAIKFTPHGGSITVRSSNPRENEIAIDIIDTGVGIEPDAMARIFLPFEQAAQHSPGGTIQGGLGLGLSIGRTLVEAHGGTLTARSSGRGKGATFTVTLPTRIPQSSTAEAPDAPSAPPRTNIRILLVEDHPDTAKIMARLLSRRGYAIHTADSLKSALELIHQTPFDLLISDIGLPDGTGIDLMKAIHAINPSIKAIALSGFGAEDDIQRSHAAGFHSHVTKPVDLQKLDAEIQRIIA